VQPPTGCQAPQASHPHDAEHDRVRDCCCDPQYPHATVDQSVSVAPGAHSPLPVHEPTLVHGDQSCQPHCDEHVRVRSCAWVPQFPHGISLCCASASPGAQTPEPKHDDVSTHSDHPPQAHPASHSRVRSRVIVPQFPHAMVSVSLSSVPAAHTPAAWQVPMFVHGSHGSHVHAALHDRARCFGWLPQLPHGSTPLSASAVPTAHSPAPSQTPTSVHADHAPHPQVSEHSRVRCCCWAPQKPQLTERVSTSTSPAGQVPWPAQVPTFVHSVHGFHRQA
jgi:hypothetical protein